MIFHFNRENILVWNQFGFRAGKTATDCLVDLVDDITKAIDEGSYAVSIFLDLSKDFDTVNHSILLSKLDLYGIRAGENQWFVNGVESNFYLLKSGVPQGSILVLFLFIVYINDTARATNHFTVRFFADDTSLTAVDDSKVFLSFSLPDVDTAIANLEQDLLRVAAWCCENQLLINPDKTKFMLIATRQLRKRFSSSPVVSFLGKYLEPVASAKDLGVTLDSHLTYDCHISNVVSSCVAKLCQINRVKNSFDGKTLEQLISSLVFSKMLYCSTEWSNTSTTNIKKLQLVQNFACRTKLALCRSAFIFQSHCHDL